MSEELRFIEVSQALLDLIASSDSNWLKDGSGNDWCIAYEFALSVIEKYNITNDYRHNKWIDGLKNESGEK